MPLRTSPALTPAMLEANRRNARKSTDPRTARGKAQTGMDALRTGEHLRLRRDLWVALLCAPRRLVEPLVRAMVTPQMAWNPIFRELAETVIQAGCETSDHFHDLTAPYRGN
ncbi:MAG: hypothetical protein ACLQVL_35745 [Terriglobia bacterium]